MISVTVHGYSLQRFQSSDRFERPTGHMIADIQNIVAKYFKIDPHEMVSDRRFREVARPRQIAMYLARQHTGRSLPDIGRRFGDRDHTTVIHAIKQVERLCRAYPEVARDVQVLSARLAA